MSSGSLAAIAGPKGTCPDSVRSGIEVDSFGSVAIEAEGTEGVKSGDAGLDGPEGLKSTESDCLPVDAGENFSSAGAVFHAAVSVSWLRRKA